MQYAIVAKFGRKSKLLPLLNTGPRRAPHPVLHRKLGRMHTPDSVSLATVSSSVSSAEAAWQPMVCRVLPDVACAAATRSHRGGTLSPCSQLHARLAGVIAGPAGGLLPHPFTPDPHTGFPVRWAGLLSVAVVVRRPLPTACPHLLFREATVPISLKTGGESGSSSTGATAGSDDYIRPIVHLSMYTKPLHSSNFQI